MTAAVTGTDRTPRGRATAVGATPTPLWEFVRETGLRSFVICDSKNPNAKFTVVLVSPVTGEAVLAVKVPTTDAAVRAVDAETRMLLDLDGIELPLASTIPRFAGSVHFDGRPGLVMTAVKGTSMRTSYLRWRHTARRSRVARDFGVVETWLAAFQEATAKGLAPLEMDGGVSARLAERYDGHDGVGDDVERLREIFARLRLQSVPRTAVHGDLWTNNLLLRDGCVSGVVDWEGATRDGAPSRDVARFGLMYALFLDRRTRAGRRVAGHRVVRAGAWGAAVDYAVNGRGWFPDLFQGFLQRNLVRLGASAAAWRDVAVAGVAEVAAFADDDDFARLHLELFRWLVSSGSPRPARTR